MKHRQEFASAIKKGDKLIPDEGFDCMSPKQEYAVKMDTIGELYVSCKCGRHYLDGQLNTDDDYVGLYHKS